MSDQSQRGQSLRTILEFVIVGLLAWTGKSLLALTTQMAVVESKVTDLSDKLNDVPTLSREVAELKVRVDAHDDAIKEVRQMRGLR